MNYNHQIQNISIEKIIPNRFQPRLSFDAQSLNELASSIKEHGIIQPLVLRKLGDKYEIIAGERRYKAATIAGLNEVPAIISNLNDNQSAEVALVENIQRKNLNSIEEAKSYRKILDRGELTQESLAKKMGISQSAIANKLRLLNLTNEVQEALMNEKISERHARSLLQILEPEKQIELLNKVIEKRLTVKKLDEEIQGESLLSEKYDEQVEIKQDEIVTDKDTIVSPNKKSTITNLLDIFNDEGYPSLEEEKTNMSFETIPVLDDVIKEIKQESNIFDKKEENLVSLENNDSQTVSIQDDNLIENTITDEIKIETIIDIKNRYKEVENSIKEAGFNINSEEFDFQDLYQIIIKIEK